MRLALFLTLTTTVSVTAGLAQISPKPAATQEAGATGVCSYYARMHNGHITAGGEKFDSNAMTAAHRKFPMGTKLKITNLVNDKSVVVTVNDRGLS